MYAPDLIDFAGNRPSWAGKHEDLMTARELVDMLRYIGDAARELAIIHATQRKDYDASNPFPRELLDCLPHDRWMVAYASGWAAIKCAGLSFEQFAVN